MEIDSQAIQHLELLEVQGTLKIKKEGSLYHYLDHTKTPFGRRMLKKWISAPLFDINKINDRLDAVEDLVKYQELIQRVQEKLKQLPDLERDVTNIYKLSAKTNLNLMTFEKLDLDSLKNFYTILEKIKYLEQILAPFNQIKKKFKSSRLKALLT